MSKQRIVALGYMRTSSAANVGNDKDSEKRQRAAIAAYAKRGGYTVAEADWFYDAAVSGADPIQDRPGFADLLARIDGNCVRVVIVESADRFARELMVQELGIAVLQARGVKLLTAGGDELTDTTDPTRTMLRQIMGAFSQFEKARLVAKLKAARERSGNMGGRPGLAETHPDVVAMAKRLAHGNRKERLSLREIAAELEKAGHVNSKGQRYSAKVVMTMLE
jgi:DNA invertase Pin-like site-specific DNA recombinase